MEKPIAKNKPTTIWLQIDNTFVNFGFGVLFPINPFPVAGRKKNHGIITDINPKRNPERSDVLKKSKKVRQVQ